MMLSGEKEHGVIRRVFLLLTLLTFIGGVYAQTEAPNMETSFFSLDGGITMSDILVNGSSFGLVMDPKLRITPGIMIGSRNGVNFSTDGIISLETQVYLRWNFLRLGSFYGNTADIFVQGGIGFLGVLKGPNDAEGPNERNTRASMLFDGTLGVTIPLSSRWHIEPSIRGGYPFIWGVSVTAGYRFPLPQRTVSRELPPRTEYVDRIEYVERTEYVEIIKTIPPSEIIRRILINQVEYIIFGPDISIYDVGIDSDARALNDMVLASTARILNENPDYRVRIEGHANPVTHTPEEVDELVALSAARANEVARLLRERGVKEEQIVVIAYGGTRAAASDHDHWNMNRRVELIVIQVDAS